MTTTEQKSAAARQRLEAVLDRVLPPEAVDARREVDWAIRDYTFAMVEECARPPEESGALGAGEGGAA